MADRVSIAARCYRSRSTPKRVEIESTVVSGKCLSIATAGRRVALSGGLDIGGGPASMPTVGAATRRNIETFRASPARSARGSANLQSGTGGTRRGVTRGHAASSNGASTQPLGGRPVRPRGDVR